MIKSFVTGIIALVFGFCQVAEARTVYLIGERHVGQQQIAVAQTMVQLINSTKINAVMVEQPDTLSYNWSEYKGLELADTGRTVCALQSIFKAHSALAEPKLRELSQVTNTYVSATDYVYLLTRLHRLPIAWFNVESRAVRDSYSDEYVQNSRRFYLASDMEAARRGQMARYNRESLRDAGMNIRPDLRERDEVMAETTHKLMNTHNMEQVVLVCGANHLGNLSELLSARGLDVIVAYNVYKEASFKPEMAALRHPDFLLEAITFESRRLAEAGTGLTSDPALQISAIAHIVYQLPDAGRVFSDLAECNRLVQQKWNQSTDIHAQLLVYPVMHDQTMNVFQFRYGWASPDCIQIPVSELNQYKRQPDKLSGLFARAAALPYRTVLLYDPLKTFDFSSAFPHATIITTLSLNADHPELLPTLVTR